MTDLKAAVFTVLEGWALPLDARKILETAYYAQPEQEPVAWIGNADFVKGQFVEGRVRRVWWECNTGVGQPLYTEPPRKEWVGLTDSDMHTIRDDAFVKNVDDIEWALQMVRRIEAKLKERNT